MSSIVLAEEALMAKLPAERRSLFQMFLPLKKLGEGEQLQLLREGEQREVENNFRACAWNEQHTHTQNSLI